MNQGEQVPWAVAGVEEGQVCQSMVEAPYTQERGRGGRRDWGVETYPWPQATLPAAEGKRVQPLPAGVTGR